MIRDHKETFDLVVIGAGSAGLSVAAGAVQLGYKTALLEKDKMGGDCLNTGCVPSKALLAAAKKAEAIRHTSAFGIRSSNPVVNFPIVKDHVSEVIAHIEPNDSVERFEGMGVTVIKGAAQFLSPREVTVDGHVLKSRYFVIATGSRPFIPPIKGLDPAKVLTNETLFALREKPEHLVIIGGGPIGIEMAQAHKRLGCDVTVIDMGHILPKDDPELVTVIREKLTAENIRLHEGASIESVQHADGRHAVSFIKDGQNMTVSGSHILVAAGRKTNTDGLHLEKAGVNFDDKGIETDARLRTSRKHIFAAGDIAGGPQFTHIAGYHAGIIIKNMIFKISAKVDYSAMPWVTYTDPELANVGMTEAMARAQYGENIKTVSWPYVENDRAITEKDMTGKIKVITDKKGRILGAGIAGSHAGELISMWGLAISRKMKISAVANMIMPYPTLSEISKRAAGSYYTPTLFSDKTRKFVALLKKLPW